jgi:hypothetical protein
MVHLQFGLSQYLLPPVAALSVFAAKQDFETGFNPWSVISAFWMAMAGQPDLAMANEGSSVQWILLPLARPLVCRRGLLQALNLLRSRSAVGCLIANRLAVANRSSTTVSRRNTLAAGFTPGATGDVTFSVLIGIGWRWPANSSSKILVLHLPFQSFRNTSGSNMSAGSFARQSGYTTGSLPTIIRSPSARFGWDGQ